MRIPGCLMLAALWFLLPSAAWAGGPSIVARDLPVGPARSPAAAQAPERFTMLGLHWQGPGRVVFRTRTLAGLWSGWQTADADTGPDPGTSEARTSAGWHLGNVVWTGSSDRIEYRVRGAVRRLRAYYVWSPATSRPVRTTAVAGLPAIATRFAWGANEGIKRAPPRYAAAVRFAIVHHTAGTNDYSPSQSAAIVRGIELYHVEGNGWNDIGYNFLVDKYGQIFEGRYGGVTSAVIGAHAQGFNRGSVGVAVIGNYQSASISPAARAALVRLLAWRLDLAHVDALSTLSWLSGGNPRFPSGIPVFLRAVSGHRDTGFTDCPGNRLYGELGQIAAQAQALGLPKLYAPEVDGTLGGSMRFSARLSSARPWTVTVTDATGKTVASGSGGGVAVEWTWDSSGLAAGRYRYSIAGGARLRPATGALGRLAPAAPQPQPKPTPVPTPTPIPTPKPQPVPLPLLSGLGLEPADVSPNGGGAAGSPTISYRLGVAAYVTARFEDASGATLATLFTDQRQSARLQSFAWNVDSLPDGRYRLVVEALSDDGTEATASADLLVDRTFSGFKADAPVFSPNGDGRLDTESFSFSLAAPAAVSLRILRNGNPVADVFTGHLEAGPQQIVWDGRGQSGVVPDGTYDAELTVTDSLGPLTQTVSFASDATAPVLTVLSGEQMRFSLSKPATVELLVDGQRVVKIEPAGVFHVPHIGVPATLKGSASDAAGNTSAPIAWTGGAAAQPPSQAS